MPEHLNIQLYEWINGLAGHSALVDTFVGLSLRNELVKAAVVGACFCAAWYGKRDDEQRLQRRRILLATVVASLLALGVSVALSYTFVEPRPYVLSKQTYRLEGNQLIPQAKLPFQAPLDNSSQDRLKRLESLDVPPNDIGSFPSDHATLFVTLSLGILLAAPRIGVLALSWTAFVILFPRICLGLHSPLDIGGGAMLGVTGLAGVWTMLRLPIVRNGFDGLGRLSMRHEALSSGLVFVMVYEMCDKFDHVQQLLMGVAGRVSAMV